MVFVRSLVFFPFAKVCAHGIQCAYAEFMTGTRDKLLLLSVCLAVFVQAGFAAQFRTRSMVAVEHPKYVPDEIVVKFKKNASHDQISLINKKNQASVIYTSSFAGFKRIKVPAGRTPQQLIELYSREPAVEYAELNHIAYALWTPNDPLYSYQWHFHGPPAGGINMPAAWDITTGNTSVIIAVIDTGVAYETRANYQLAPDLVNTVFVPGYNFVRDNTHANDDDGHGTHVTGTLAQTTNNNYGVAGIAFNCAIMPVKVLNKKGEAPYTQVAEGVYFAADNGADVINLSLGGPYDDTTLRNAIAYAHNHGVVIVCAAGNEAQSGNDPHYPAAYPQSIAVGATQYDRNRAPYSNTGSYLDLVAPGGNNSLDQNGDGNWDGILQQTFGDNPRDWSKWWLYEGTSMAAPHVSATAALLIANGLTDPNLVREALENTADDLGSPGWDSEYGWGIINPYAALNYCPSPPLADFNADCVVDMQDLAALCTAWLMAEPSKDIAPPAGDGIVNFLDFAVLAAQMQ